MLKPHEPRRRAALEVFVSIAFLIFQSKVIKGGGGAISLMYQRSEFGQNKKTIIGSYPDDGSSSPGRSVLKIHVFIESGLKMIQFKRKSGIFIQKNIH